MYTRQRGAEQLAADGRVRDRRKHNRSEANLNEGQQDCLLTYIYDEFEQKKDVNYEKEFYNKTPSHDTGHGTGSHWH